MSTAPVSSPKNSTTSDRYNLSLGYMEKNSLENSVMSGLQAEINSQGTFQQKLGISVLPDIPTNLSVIPSAISTPSFLFGERSDNILTIDLTKGSATDSSKIFLSFPPVNHAASPLFSNPGPTVSPIFNIVQTARRKILDNEGIISGFQASHYFKKNLEASPQEIQWWLGEHLTVLKTDKRDNNQEIEIEQIFRGDTAHFFLENEIKTFAPTEKERLITFAEIIKRPFFSGYDKEEIKRFLIDLLNKEQYPNSKLLRLLDFNPSSASSLRSFEVQTKKLNYNHPVEQYFFVLRDIVKIEKQYYNNKFINEEEFAVQKEIKKLIEDKSGKKKSLKSFVKEKSVKLAGVFKDKNICVISQSEKAQIILNLAIKEGVLESPLNQKEKLCTIKRYLRAN